jgi:hypothetical protein
MKTNTEIPTIKALKTEANAAAEKARQAAEKASAARNAVAEVEAHFDRLCMATSHANTRLSEAIKNRRASLGAIGDNRPTTLADKVLLLKQNHQSAQAMALALSGDHIAIWDALVESVQSDFDRALSELQLFCRAQDFKEALKYIALWMGRDAVSRESSYYQYDLSDCPMS